MVDDVHDLWIPTGQLYRKYCEETGWVSTATPYFLEEIIDVLGVRDAPMTKDDIQAEVAERLDVPAALLPIVDAAAWDAGSRGASVFRQGALDTGYTLKNFDSCIEFAIHAGVLVQAGSGTLRLHPDPQPVWRVLTLTTEQERELRETIEEIELQQAGERILELLGGHDAPLRPASLTVSIRALAARLQATEEETRYAVHGLLKTYPVTADVDPDRVLPTMPITIAIDWPLYDAYWISVTIEITED